jgi:hypothetical protein
VANTKPRDLTVLVTFRCSEEDSRLLKLLTEKRATEAREAGYEIEPTTAGCLRWMIRKEAKAAGFSLDAPAAPRGKRGARG